MQVLVVIGPWLVGCGLQSIQKERTDTFHVQKKKHKKQKKKRRRTDGQREGIWNVECSHANANEPNKLTDCLYKQSSLQFTFNAAIFVWSLIHSSFFFFLQNTSSSTNIHTDQQPRKVRDSEYTYLWTLGMSLARSRHSTGACSAYGWDRNVQ